MEQAVSRDQRFFNRELSWIDFNDRILEEGLRQDLLPLDRFKYLSIVSSNFDEFFMIRVAAMKRAYKGRTGGAPPDPAGLSYEDQLHIGAAKIRSIIQRQYACLEQEIFPALAQGGLELLRPHAYTPAHWEYLDSFFMQDIYPLLTPLRLEDTEALPSIESYSLYGAFLLSPESPMETAGVDRISLIRIPPVLDRIIWLPQHRQAHEGAAPEKTSWALLEDLVLTFGAALYPGYRVKEQMLFKINRDADFSVDEKRDEDFIEAMEEVLESRGTSMAVRMVFSPGSQRLQHELSRRLLLDAQDLYEVRGPLNLGSLLELVHTPGFDHLRENPWRIYGNPSFTDVSPDGSLWDRIRQKDVLLHLPYQSFDPVIRFFQAATYDPQVIAIKTALYRTSGNSPIVKALEEAALKGKQVTAVVELKARFDEERNISWANRLEKAGVIVIYGLSRLKVHAKVSLIIRRENDRIKRYVHLSTGNYNDKTAKIYEDIGIFTARDEIAFDVGLLFNMITGYSVIQSMQKLVIAPTSLKHRLLDLIDRETKRSNQEYPGRIMAKMNALADIEIIQALYRASAAGVKVLLNIRGICMLVPGLPGLSDNIRVISIIDHYLEHSRIFYFANGGAEELFLSSADWMPRNLERRVELMFPVLQEDLRRHVLAILDAYFRDNCQARVLGSDGVWRRLRPFSDEKPFRVQTALLDHAREISERPWTNREEFIVRRSPPGESPGVHVP
ncbi:MAG: polyphosphate kinase 1 [Treponema sp.]|jgi:polyphosphate kinase|nr:polyphosphate kinase 1 [Treponema sp.]